MSSEQTTLKICEKQNWHKYNLAKTLEKQFFYELLGELSELIPEPAHENGRPPIPIKDLFFICCLKIYSNYSSRKIHHDVKESEKAGYIKKAPHFNRLSAFLNCPVTYDLLKKILVLTAIPLKEIEDSFSIDSSGFGSYQYERWQRVKYRKKETTFRNYLKGHICIGTKTNVICSAEVTYGNANDSKQVEKILDPLKEFKPKEISADKAYSTHRTFQIIQSLGALPFIPFKSNTKKERDVAPEIWNRMFRYFKTHREEFNKHYHKRSNVETTFGMIKLRLGEFLKSKTYEAQRNELMIKFIVHNITVLVQEIFERDIHVDFRKAIKKTLKER